MFDANFNPPLAAVQFLPQEGQFLVARLIDREAASMEDVPW
jgi:hypothetical protein